MSSRENALVFAALFCSTSYLQAYLPATKTVELELCLEIYICLFTDRVRRRPRSTTKQ